MGDRYELTKNCAYCNTKNSEIWYAPTSDSYTFKCEKCKRTNFIKSNFEAVKIEEATFEEIKNGFLNTTMGSLTDEEIDRCCDDTFEHIKKLK